MTGVRMRRNSKSAIEETLAMQIELNGLPACTREHRFDAARLWRFDFAWPDRKLAAECEGGIWVAGRHTRGSGFAADLEKYNAAALQGWLVLRFTRPQVYHGDAISLLLKAIQLRPCAEAA